MAGATTERTPAEVFGPQLDEWVQVFRDRAGLGSEQATADLFVTFQRRIHPDKVSMLLALAVSRLAVES